MFSISINNILLIGKNLYNCFNFSIYLLSNILNVSTNYLFIFYDIKINFLLYSKYIYLSNKKLFGWPIGYILKKEKFYKIDVLLDIGILVPRYETSIFLEKLFNVIYKYNITNILELGYGTGIMSLLLGNFKFLFVKGIDSDLNSFFYAIKNLYNLKNFNIDFYYNNWTMFYCNKYDFDIIFSNPPYINFDSFIFLNNNLIPFESKKSLLSNNFGLCEIIFIIRFSYMCLNKKGFLLIEHGFRHSFIVRKILIYFGYVYVNTYTDQYYYDRITIGVKL
ncbi:MAG: hypothetical protein HYZ30_00130 [Candidatus Azosocius agrarius]|nr:MAG: hypothetical protein HYZ30_00130 [Gammaproteobacteria bacterium]